MSHHYQNLNVVQWVIKHPMKALLILATAGLIGTAGGYFFPGLAEWMLQVNLLDTLGKIAGFAIGLMIAVAIIASAFLGR